MKTHVNSWTGGRGFWKIGIVLLAILWLVLLATTWAEAAQAAEAANNNDGEFSFNWLDPEKKIYVLQNRRYTKADRVVLSVMAGSAFSNPYRTAWTLDGRIAFYFSEAWGVEGFYRGTSNSANNTFNALIGTKTPDVLPLIREIQSEYGGLVHWVPWYAKINVFNSILYFDWYFAAGLGQMNTRLGTYANAQASPSYQNQDLFALYWGTGHLYHFGEHFLFRLDLTGGIYQAQIFGTSGDKTWYSNNNLAFGLGWAL